MNRFHGFLEKRNFKRIFAVYLIAAVLCGVLCAGAVGLVYWEKISLALQYEKASEHMNPQEITALANTSDDICDVLLLDDQNNILSSGKNSSFAAGNTFVLRRAEGSRLFCQEGRADAAFRFVKSDEFMLHTVLADHAKEWYEENDEDGFYAEKVQNRKVYLISRLGKEQGRKAIVISDPKPVPYGMLTLKLAASVAMLLFMIYWIIVALWVYQNAEKAQLFAPAWGILTLFTNLAGVFVYAIYRHISSVCSACGAVQPQGNVFCRSCGHRIGRTCARCGHVLKPSDRYCPRCGQEQ